MSKKNEAAQDMSSAPEGYEDQSSDAIGMWDPEQGPIHFVPSYARLIDSHIEPKRFSCLVFGQLIDPCTVKPPADSDEDSIRAQPGDLVGVWITPGNKEILNWEGTRVFCRENGTKDTGKPSPMQLYKVSTEPGRTRRLVRLETDYRDKSKASPTPWDAARKSDVVSRSDADESEDDFGF